MKADRFLRVLCFFAFVCALSFAGDKRCEKLSFHDEESVYMRGYSCFYPAQTIAGAYADFRSGQIAENVDDPSYKILRVELKVGKNYEETYKNTTAIKYLWDNDKTLNVNIIGESKETNVGFIQEASGTRMSVIFSTY
ncbi:MAG: hypothetical protein LBI57_03725 [Helicobacteraceae bacterium]|nr:hypothetical protein [Helicobacteraceae bacterium]